MLLQVNHQEWSYGYAPSGSGVYSCKPMGNPMYTFRETVALGVTQLNPTEVCCSSWLTLVMPSASVCRNYAVQACLCSAGL